VNGAVGGTAQAISAPVVIYTDGACKGNPGPGGWGALLLHGEREREMYGGDSATTNNRMELTAVIKALESLRRSCTVELYTDSQYVKNGIETWIHGWKRNGWKTADRKPVKNADLWRELDLLAARHRIRWHWVKGHADTVGNQRADALANLGVGEIQR
jgi:ribonuclease HI